MRNPRRQPRKTNEAPSREATARREESGDRNQRSRSKVRKPLTEKPDNVSGKRLTKLTVLVVHRTGFIRSGVLSLIAKSGQFTRRGETGEAPLARELFLRH